MGVGSWQLGIALDLEPISPIGPIRPIRYGSARVVSDPTHAVEQPDRVDAEDSLPGVSGDRAKSGQPPTAEPSRDQRKHVCVQWLASDKQSIPQQSFP